MESERKANLKDRSWHGTRGGYTNHMCRCPACTEANRLHQFAYRERERAKRKEEAEAA